MKVYVSPGTFPHERRFLNGLARSCLKLGHEVTRSHGDEHDAAILWNGRHYQGGAPALYAEMGWLPRWSYQLGPGGINAASTLPRADIERILLRQEKQRLEEWLERCRRDNPLQFHHLNPEAVPTAIGDEIGGFLLVPLQVETDTNMSHVPEELRTQAGLIRHIVEWNPPLPIVWKQHPAVRGTVRGIRPKDRILHPNMNIHAALKSRHCRGVVTLNSNSAHDALIWEKPVIALGRGIWPDGVFDSTLPASWEAFEAFWNSRKAVNRRLAYIDWLIRAQWLEADATDHGRLRLLLEGLTPRKRTARSRGLIVNAYCSDWGWLFEDLKARFTEASTPEVTVISSPAPVPEADAWIAIRGSQCGSSPDPDRTIAQIHDLGPPGPISAKGISMVHWQQPRLLGSSGVNLGEKELLLRPIGAPQCFEVRDHLADSPRIGWVGRDTGSKGTETAARALGKANSRTPLTAVLAGSQIEKMAETLRRMKVPVDLRPREQFPFATYPQMYAELDALVICSPSEAGPLPLFEALACGVPVISTDVGWASRVIVDGVTGFIVPPDPQEIAARVREIVTDRQAWFARRHSIRACAGGWTLDGWIEDNLEMARRLA